MRGKWNPGSGTESSQQRLRPSALDVPGGNLPAPSSLWGMACIAAGNVVQNRKLAFSQAKNNPPPPPPPPNTTNSHRHHPHLIDAGRLGIQSALGSNALSCTRPHVATIVFNPNASARVVNHTPPSIARSCFFVRIPLISAALLEHNHRRAIYDHTHRRLPTFNRYLTFRGTVLCWYIVAALLMRVDKENAFETH